MKCLRNMGAVLVVQLAAVLLLLGTDCVGWGALILVISYTIEDVILFRTVRKGAAFWEARRERLALLILQPFFLLLLCLPPVTQLYDRHYAEQHSRLKERILVARASGIASDFYNARSVYRSALRSLIPAQDRGLAKDTYQYMASADFCDKALAGCLGQDLRSLPRLIAFAEEGPSAWPYFETTAESMVALVMPPSIALDPAVAAQWHSYQSNSECMGVGRLLSAVMATDDGREEWQIYGAAVTDVLSQIAFLIQDVGIVDHIP
jgi:hypothetical protein